MTCGGLAADRVGSADCILFIPEKNREPTDYYVCKLIFDSTQDSLRLLDSALLMISFFRGRTDIESTSSSHFSTYRLPRKLHHCIVEPDFLLGSVKMAYYGTDTEPTRSYLLSEISTMALFMPQLNRKIHKRWRVVLTK